MLYLDNKSTDPIYNLALEEYAFTTLSQNTDLFMLWQNNSSIIVGRYQNTAEQVNNEFISVNNVPVVRRLTGGGAVYHDLGNLNFTFIVHTEDMTGEAAELSNIVLGGLRSLGITAYAHGRNDILVDGKKVSGSALMYENNKLLFHGTLLINMDIEKMALALTVSEAKIESKGIKSIRSRVSNLLSVGIEQAKDALLEAVKSKYSISYYEPSDSNIMAVEQLRENKYSSWDWNWGESPPCTIEKKRRFKTVGEIRVCINVTDGVIVSFYSDGDYFAQRNLQELQGIIIGVKYTREDIADALKSTDIAQYYANLSKEDFLSLLLV